MHAPSARTRKLVRHSAGPVAVLLAGLMVWQGSLAALSATTSNEGNVWRLAAPAEPEEPDVQVGLTTAPATTMFIVDDLAPGEAGQECIDVRSTTNVPGEVRFYLSDVTGPSEVTDNLMLAVERGPMTDSWGCDEFEADPTAPPAEAQSLSALGTDYATGIAPWRLNGRPDPGLTRENNSYRITWHLDAEGLTPEEAAEFAGEEVRANFTWEVQTDA